MITIIINVTWNEFTELQQTVIVVVELKSLIAIMEHAYYNIYSKNRLDFCEKSKGT